MQSRWYLTLLGIFILLCNTSVVLAVDTDGDGADDDLDLFPFDSSQQLDSDFDGFGDNPVGNNSDACPLEFGTSLTDALGCVDDDGDGIRNSDDKFPSDDQQWLDRDGDGFGDNLVGENGDACPDEPNEDNHGCAEVQQAAAEKLQGEAGTPVFTLAILISIVVGIILGIKLPKISDAENMWNQEDEKPFISILFGVLFLTSLIPAFALVTNTAADGVGEGEIWLDDDENSTFLAWSDLDENGLVDQFFVYFKVETSSIPDVELRIQLNITLKAEDLNDESFTETRFYHTNISNSTPENGEEVILPWAIGNYTAELWIQEIVNGIPSGYELNKSMDTVVYMEEMEYITVIQVEVDGDLWVEHACGLEIEINDDLETNWQKNGTWEIVADSGTLVDGASSSNNRLEYSCDSLPVGEHHFEINYESYFGNNVSLIFDINIILETDHEGYCLDGYERNQTGFCPWDGSVGDNQEEVFVGFEFDMDQLSESFLNLTAQIESTNLEVAGNYDVDYYLWHSNSSSEDPIDTGWYEFTTHTTNHSEWDEWPLSGPEHPGGIIDRGEEYCLRVELWMVVSNGEYPSAPLVVDNSSCVTIPPFEEENNSAGEENNSTGEENNSTGGEEPLGEPPLISVDVSFSSEIFILLETNECRVNLSVNEWTNTSIIVIKGSPIAGTKNTNNLTIDCSNWPVGVHHLSINSSAANGQYQVSMISLIIEDEELVALSNTAQLVDELESTSIGEVLVTLIGLCVGIMAAVAIVVGVIYSRMNRIVSIDLEEGAGVMINFEHNSRLRE